MPFYMRRTKAEIPESLLEKQKELLQEIVHLSYKLSKDVKGTGQTERMQMMTELIYQIGLQVIGSLSFGIHQVTLDALEQMQRETMEEEMK